MEPINLISNLSTPCFVLDKEELHRSIVGFQSALCQNFKSAIVGYSVKTNSTLYCLKYAGEIGVMAEVVCIHHCMSAWRESNWIGRRSVVKKDFSYYIHKVISGFLKRKGIFMKMYYVGSHRE